PPFPRARGGAASSGHRAHVPGDARGYVPLTGDGARGRVHRRPGAAVMIQRSFGRTGRQVSLVGFGAWAVGGGMWAGARDGDARAAFRYGIDHGVTFFDTAQVYGDGHSESLIGAFTASLPAASRPMVATKVPPKHYVWELEDDADLDEVFPSRYVEKSVE